MSTAHFNTNERVACRIMTVDPATRRVEGSIKDGSIIQIRVREIPTTFRWPAVGEVWAVQRKNFDWELVARFENLQDSNGQIEKVPEGVTQIHGSRVKMGDGRDVVITDESLAANGNAPIWNAVSKKWIPGAAGGGPSYAIQVKRHAPASAVVVPSGTLPAIAYNDVYFENNNGVMEPSPPDSMWDPANPTILTVPVDGLWGFRAAYAYSAIPLGTFHQTVVHASGSPVAVMQHAREALPAGSSGSSCTCVGTAKMFAGDWLTVRAYQESGADQSIEVTPGYGNNDVPGLGPVFAMWLIAPRV